MDRVSGWRFCASSAQLVQGQKQGHLMSALGLFLELLVAISVSMWGKPSGEWSWQAKTKWEWGVGERETETERDTEGEREEERLIWRPCWAPRSSFAWCQVHPRLSQFSESRWDQQPAGYTWGPGLTDLKSRIHTHIKQRHSSKKAHIDSFQPCCIFREPHPPLIHFHFGIDKPSSSQVTSKENFIPKPHQP